MSKKHTGNKNEKMKIVKNSPWYDGVQFWSHNRPAKRDKYLHYESSNITGLTNDDGYLSMKQYGGRDILVTTEMENHNLNKFERALFTIND